MKREGISAETLTALFPQRTSDIVTYAEVLAGTGVARGLIGPREVPRLWDRHILNCVVVAPLFSAGATIADIGSGAGLPGLVIAIARPDLEMTLVEPLLRRSTFLLELVDRLELPVEVVRARAEQLHGSRRYDYVTARAVAPLARLVGWALPLCSPGGELVALKGSSVQDELVAAGPQLRRHNAGAVEIEHYGAGVVTPLTTVVRIKSP